MCVITGTSKTRKMTQALFNTDPALWDVNRQPGTIVQIADGHIIRDGEVVARFADNDEAESCLADAGWKRIKGVGWKAVAQ